ncbi:MAG: hypothetical protein QOG74_1917, partial [Alphaproteobacteria bacterium]|nr:hypothetical protein [Alphaproteobacteria bacterium]
MNAVAAGTDRAPVAPPELLVLRTAQAVRSRCATVHRWVAEGHSP